MRRLQETCVVCNKPFTDDDDKNEHHPIYRSRGGDGTPTQTVHRDCHLALHAADFKAWGSIGGQITATTKVWSLNLLNVRAHPAHGINREFYRLFYSH
jgi:hypothetical protein